uniref:Uncharacterized protein n=1 Tax=Aegilops tauschii TaxID=37682 RepID=M8BHM7_AEGTA
MDEGIMRGKSLSLGMPEAPQGAVVTEAIKIPVDPSSSTGRCKSVGEHVHEVAVGDTVVPVFSAQCGGCPDWRLPLRPQLPARPGMPRDGTARFSFAATGEPIHNFTGVSSFTEYTVVDVAHVVIFPRPPSA